MKGNVLVIGNSGVGKSTLINAVLGEECAETGWGTSGTTDHLEIYKSDELPFCIIDSVGFEPSFIKRTQAINAVKKWSKKSAKEGNRDTQINVIWICVEGTSGKLFPETIKSIVSATEMWKTVPIIVVITKSYSIEDRQNNINMVRNVFAEQKKRSKNLRKIIPVIAATYRLNDSAFAAPDGIEELIDATNEVMPEGIKTAENDIFKFKLKRKKALAQSVIAAATTGGVVVGAVPVPIADALILSPIEVAEINALAQIYGIRKNEESKQFFNSIVEVGTVSVAAKGVISSLKAIPGINLAAGVINAIIAGSFVAAVGEGTAYAFEQVYLGKKTVSDIDWIKKVIESKLSKGFVEKVTKAAKKISRNTNKNEIAKIILDIFR